MSTGDADEVERWLRDYLEPVNVLPIGKRISWPGDVPAAVVALGRWADSFVIYLVTDAIGSTSEAGHYTFIAQAVDDVGNTYRAAPAGGAGALNQRAYWTSVFTPALDARATSVALFQAVETPAGAVPENKPFATFELPGR